MPLYLFSLGLNENESVGLSKLFNQTPGVFIFLCFSFITVAQKADFQYFNIEDGLSGNFTSDLTQDNQGLIWLINDYKLHRFDGRVFVRYPLTEDVFTTGRERLGAVVSYHDSLLLVLGQTQLFIMNPRTDTWQSISLPAALDNKPDLVFWYAGKIGSDHFFFTNYRNPSSYELWKFNNGQFLQTSLIKILASPFARLILDKTGGLYVLDNDIITHYDHKGRPNKTIPLPADCKSCRYVNIQPGKENEMLYTLLTPQGGCRLYVHDLIKDEITLHPASRFLIKNSNVIGSVVFREIENGDLWIIGLERSIMYYEARQDTLYDFTLQVKQLIPNVNDLLYPELDNTGTVWVNTRLGLLKVTLQSSAFDQYFTEPQTYCQGLCSFRGIAEDQQGIIYAGFYRGIASFDPQQKRILSVFAQQEETPFPWGLHADTNGLWLNNGNLLDPSSGTIRSIPGSDGGVTEAGLFAEDKNGRLWWVHIDDLFFLNKEGNELHWEQELELPNKGLYHTEAICAGKTSGKLWISQKGQLLQYSPTDKQQKWFTAQDWGLPVTRILAIVEDVKGAVWMGTDIGLVYFDPAGGQVVHFTEADGLPNNFICGMLPEGDSCLWLSTNIGLSRFKLSDQSFINFFEEDGLSHNEFNRISFFQAHDGRMFFGGLRGINAFIPQELMENYQRQNEAAQVVLSAFEYVDEKQDTVFRRYGFSVQPTIQLNYWHRSFTFEYVLTDYRNPKEIYYSYQMEGYEDTWSEPSPFNFTRFSSLPAGDYTFRVKARDSHGIWHPNQLEVKVTVHPPWWETNWAYLAYGLLFLGIGYVVFYILKRRLLLQNKLHLQAKEAERLKELDAFKSRLYTNLTHEFRTPLTVILGMNQQIQQDPLKYAATGTQMIQHNGQNLLRLINQLLDLSKLEDNSFELHLQQGDIVPFLRYITESFQTYANSKNLSLTFFTTQESLVMDFDEDQTQQVLTNLISNALKFTPSGGKVTVRLTQEKQQLIIEVQDTGIGITEKDLPYIFDRFYQSDQSHTREGEGTGIGLAHTKELVKLMDGTIQVSSIIGEGTRFFVSLPIRREAPKRAVQPELRPPLYIPPPAMELSTASTAFTPKETDEEHIPQLLIIEDNQDVVVYLKSCFEGLYDVQVAYNGRIGVEKALEEIPDLIISDVMMPEKDGFEVCEILKNDERTSHIPIILLTAKADASSKIAGLRRGADAYLSKPFNKEELFVRLAMLIEKQRRLVAYFSNQLLEKTATTPNVEDDIQIENAFLDKVQQIVEANYSDENFALPDLCQKIGMSRSQLFRKMKALINVAPSAYIRDYRLNRARSLLETTDLTISEVAWQVGFKSAAHFSKTFQGTFGYAPSATIR